MVDINQCRDKHKHPSKGKADAHLRHLVATIGREEDEFNTYCCDLCGFWHVGRAKRATVERRGRRHLKGY